VAVVICFGGSIIFDRHSSCSAFRKSSDAFSLGISLESELDTLLSLEDEESLLEELELDEESSWLLSLPLSLHDFKPFGSKPDSTT
jgi:hypothetical protein